jgi:hypothetical protein
MNTKKRGRGRPQKYPLTGNQVKSIESRIRKGQSLASISKELGVHSYAVLRVRRGM